MLMSSCKDCWCRSFGMARWLIVLVPSGHSFHVDNDDHVHQQLCVPSKCPQAEH